MIFKDDTRRAKRGVLDYGNSFLSDVIKQLSTELYSFKRARIAENADLRSLEYAENKIGTCKSCFTHFLTNISVISDLLRFSDCSNETACGFAEYGRPQTEENRSPLFVFLFFQIFKKQIDFRCGFSSLWSFSRWEARLRGSWLPDKLSTGQGTASDWSSRHDRHCKGRYFLTISKKFPAPAPV